MNTYLKVVSANYVAETQIHTKQFLYNGYVNI